MKTALLFAGQGAQVVGMGRDFADKSPSAQALFHQADQVLGYPLSSVCFNGPEDALTNTENAQPAIFLVSWVALTLLRERCPGLGFEATAGLSLGEFTALAAAGAMTFEDALRVVRLRGRFMQEACDATQGGMAAIIGLDEDSTAKVCSEAGITMANLNCPGQIVVSGAIEKIPKAVELAIAAGARKAIPLSVAGAYHSPLMASAQPKLQAELKKLVIHPTIVPAIANVTASPHQNPADTEHLLVEQVTAPVYWEKSMRYLLAQGFRRFIELGPGTTLAGFMKRIDKSALVLNVSDMESLDRTASSILAV
jgi:[acyl-carrier-protein] S-malonyltransferase